MAAMSRHDPSPALFVVVAGVLIGIAHFAQAEGSLAARVRASCALAETTDASFRQAYNKTLDGLDRWPSPARGLIAMRLAYARTRYEWEKENDLTRKKDLMKLAAAYQCISRTLGGSSFTFDCKMSDGGRVALAFAGGGSDSGFIYLPGSLGQTGRWTGTPPASPTHITGAEVYLEKNPQVLSVWTGKIVDRADVKCLQLPSN
jgi:hypothetical protein